MIRLLSRAGGCGVVRELVCDPIGAVRIGRVGRAGRARRAMVASLAASVLTADPAAAATAAATASDAPALKTSDAPSPTASDAPSAIASVEATASDPHGRVTRGGTIRFELEFFAGGAEQPVSRATVFASGRRLRIEQQRAGSAAPVFIYRGDRNRLYSISETTRSYVELEPELLAKLDGSRTRDARREVDDGLAALPQDQQRAFGHLLGIESLDPKRPGEPLMVSRTGGVGTVSNIACDRVELSRGRRLLATGCIADWKTVGLAPEDIEVFRSLAALVNDATGSRLPLPIEMVPGQPLDLVVQFGGLPLVFERAGQARGASAIRVASVEWIEGGDALYEVPEGFAVRRGTTGLASLARLLAPSAGASRASRATAVPAAPAPWSGSEHGGDGAAQAGLGASGSGRPLAVASEGLAVEAGAAVAEAPAVARRASASRRARDLQAFEAGAPGHRIVYRPIRLFEDGRE